jgi:hypothetical protein
VVELVDSAGKVVGTASTDQFGLYRMDGIPPGSYQLAVSPRNLPEIKGQLPTRPVEIRDDFLFGQDLELPFEVSLPSAEPETAVQP